jgi:hypothetical protein
MSPIFAQMGKQFLKVLVPGLYDVLKDALKRSGVWIEDGIKKQIKDMNCFPGNVESKTVRITKELLKKEDITEAAKNNIVPNSNMVAALLEKKEDIYIVYLAFLRDKELLPSNENRYVVIKAEGLSRDVETLFDGQSLVVLK